MSTGNKIARFASRYPFVGPLAALALVSLFFVSARFATFARTATLIQMARQTSVVGIAATGATMIILLGGIDLSIGSAVALATVVIALALKAGSAASIAILLSALVLAAAGVVNGVLTAKVGITPFIVTLGTMSIMRGAAKGLANEQKIDVDAHGIDALVLPSRGLFGLPMAVWLLVVIALFTAWLLHATRFGRHIYAIGSNERTARICGVPVDRVKILVYMLGGVLAAIAGTVEFGTLTVGDPTDSIGLELQVIAAVVIGGASLSGGEGSIVGTIIGAFLMTVIATGCQYMGLSNWVQEIITGSIIIAAAALDRLRHQRLAAG